MGKTIITANELSKCYRLGTINRSTLVDEVRYWLCRLGRKDPRQYFSKLGHAATEARMVASERAGDKEFWALQDVSFTVEAGQTLGIIGRNGAGKSTLLKILSRITAPTTGEVDIMGRVGSLLEVGTGFHPELTGMENIYMNGTILGMKKKEIDEKIDDIVSFAELEKFVNTPVKRYSSGMYVRLAFSVAAHLDPEILLVDEVLAVGDMEFQKKCMKKMEDVTQGGRTILFVSHNLAAVSRLCERSILLEDGKIVASGPTDDVLSKYMTSSSGASASKIWKESQQFGDHGFRLMEISVCDSDGVIGGSVSVTKELYVRIRYRTDERGMKFRSELFFHTQGVIAFSSIERQEALHEEPGEYEVTVTIPANTLAEGEYIGNLLVFSSRGHRLYYCKAKEAVMFHVTDSVSGDSARGDYSGSLGGVMRPKLDWSRKKVRGHRG